MSDIFVSYASADRDRARALADALTERGWSVWWDRTIPPGREFDQVIEEALDASRCVVVLWSQTSVASTWVKTEAAEAMRRKVLVPALIDAVRIPLEFRRLQAADLSNWKGERSHEELQKFFQSIETHVARTAPARPAPEPTPLQTAPEYRATAAASPLLLRPERSPPAHAEPPPPTRVEPPLPTHAGPPVSRPRSRTKAIIISIVALVVAAAAATAYDEYAKRVALEEKMEKERRAANDARLAADEAARVARERAAKAERERAERLAEQQRQQQQTASKPSTLKLDWQDSALRFSGVLTAGRGASSLRATIWDLRTGARIGDYDVPVNVQKQGASDYVVSGDFSIPGDSTTPSPHTHTSRLLLRSQADGSVRFIQNCPRAGECYPAR